MANLWILFILPAIAFAADQRTTVNFPSNNGPSQQQSSNGAGMQQSSAPDSFFRNPAPTLPERQSMVGGQQSVVVEGYPNPNMGYYPSRNPVVSGNYGPHDPMPSGPGVVFPQGPAEVPNFYFNAGFNKGNNQSLLLFH
jgi:hypothetical protein